jgi:CheY-like chemotaxis protein
VLVADDDLDFLKLFEFTLEDAHLPIVAHFVNDGQEILDYLDAAGAYADAPPSSSSMYRCHA